MEGCSLEEDDVNLIGSATLPLPEGVAKRIRLLAQTLGYLGDPGYFEASRAHELPSYRHPISQAIQQLGIAGCFGFLTSASSGHARFNPVVYLAGALDEAAADEVHRLVWSQGIVPLLLVATPEGLQLRNAFRFQRGSALAPVPWSRAISAGMLHHRFDHLRAGRLRGSIAWRDFTPLVSDRVDTRLMAAIKGLSGVLQRNSPALRDRADLINSVIARFIYLFVLVDRNVIDQAWVDGLTWDGAPACATIRLGGGSSEERWSAEETWRLLDNIDDALNGTIFPVSEEDRKLVGEATLHDVRKVIRNGDVLVAGMRQASFLDVSFATLRTETLSAIYELFLQLQDETGRKQEGAFYTPPFVADYMIDELDCFAPLGDSSRVFDPSAGSGIFLVGAFRRIAEASATPTGGSIAHLWRLRDLLARCIFGVEKNPQAANVARLSLYLTLLDYARGASLAEIQKALGGERLFPPLDANVVCGDYFSERATARHGSNSFTHVVGNPPWGKLPDRQKAAATYLEDLSTKYPVDLKRTEEVFFWKIVREAVAPGGAIALLMSTKCFVSASARLFPVALAKNVALVGLSNLSHFRYRMFKEAKSPATIVFARAAEADDLEPVWVYAPLLTSQPMATNGQPWAIVADRDGLNYVRHEELRASPRAWPRTLMLQPFDRRNAVVVTAAASSRDATFGAFLERARMFVTKGVSPGDSDLPEELILAGDANKPNYYRTVLGLDQEVGLLPFPVSSGSYELTPDHLAGLNERQRRKFGGNVLAITRHMIHFDLIERPAAFNSTVNLLAFEDEASQAEVGRRRSVLKTVERYLRSDVADYMFALVGRTWLLDKRRLEIGDLLDLPFPFVSEADARDAQGRDFEPEFLGKRLGLGGWFRDAVEQYASRRKGYQDGQVPQEALEQPTDDMRGLYGAVLRTELATAFGPRATLRFSRHILDASDYIRFSVTIGARRAGNPANNMSDVNAPYDGTEQAWTGFNDSCKTWYDPQTSTVTVVKPRTIAAWTQDRAYADHLRIVRQVATS